MYLVVKLHKSTVLPMAHNILLRKTHLMAKVCVVFVNNAAFWRAVLLTHHNLLSWVDFEYLRAQLHLEGMVRVCSWLWSRSLCWSALVNSSDDDVRLSVAGALAWNLESGFVPNKVKSGLVVVRSNGSIADTFPSFLNDRWSSVSGTTGYCMSLSL